MFSHSARTSSSARASMASATRSKARLRSAGVQRFQAPKADRAEAMAASTSSAPETGASAKTSPVLGSTNGAVRPDAGGTLPPVYEVVQLPHFPRTLLTGGPRRSHGAGHGGAGGRPGWPSVAAS